ncbi:MAG TPA: Xaa-Pro peptidase family protein [Pyrinomonadaceae bacterium]|nr:Xaa-Pro peptidase family protein [Pyrinomonadaceae bacterium]
MKRDDERIERIQAALQRSGLDALVCALPANVLMLSGYWPVVGTSLAIATKDGSVVLIIPEDEKELTETSWADEVRTFSGGSLRELKSVIEIVSLRLAEVLPELNIKRGCILGFESGPIFEPASYASMHLYGAAIYDLLHMAARFVALMPARELLAELRSSLTAGELNRVRAACRVARNAFSEGAKALRAGLQEVEVGAMFRAPLSIKDSQNESVMRSDGFTFCMSGPNSAHASAAYQISRTRKIRTGDFVLVHCNSYADGYWTDITRTFSVGEIDERKRAMYEAVFAARRAALDTVRAGVKASEVDRATRDVLTERGFGEGFRHGLGHGVGFHAINHNAPPRLHPASEDVLETGMVFNIEPAIYMDGYGGLRHCDMVAVTKKGVEVLTPFQSSVEQLIIRS